MSTPIMCDSSEAQTPSQQLSTEQLRIDMPIIDHNQKSPSRRLYDHISGRNRVQHLAAFDAEIMELEQKRARATEVHNGFKSALVKLHRGIDEATITMGSPEYKAFVDSMQEDFARDRRALSMLRLWMFDLDEWKATLREMKGLWTQVWDVYGDRQYGRTQELEDYMGTVEKELQDAFWKLSFAKQCAEEHSNATMRLADFQA